MASEGRWAPLKAAPQTSSSRTVATAGGMAVAAVALQQLAVPPVAVAALAFTATLGVVHTARAETPCAAPREPLRLRLRRAASDAWAKPFVRFGAAVLCAPPAIAALVAALLSMPPSVAVGVAAFVITLGTARAIGLGPAGRLPEPKASAPLGQAFAGGSLQDVAADGSHRLPKAPRSRLRAALRTLAVVAVAAGTLFAAAVAAVYLEIPAEAVGALAFVVVLGAARLLSRGSDDEEEEEELSWAMLRAKVWSGLRLAGRLFAKAVSVASRLAVVVSSLAAAVVIAELMEVPAAAVGALAFAVTLLAAHLVSLREALTAGDDQEHAGPPRPTLRMHVARGGAGAASAALRTASWTRRAARRVAMALLAACRTVVTAVAAVCAFVGRHRHKVAAAAAFGGMTLALIAAAQLNFYSMFLRTVAFVLSLTADVTARAADHVGSPEVPFRARQRGIRKRARFEVTSKRLNVGF